MKSILKTVVLLLLVTGTTVSVSQTHKKAKTTQKRPSRPVKHEPESEQSTMPYPGFRPKQINWNPAPTDLFIPGKIFSPELALKGLFPGSPQTLVSDNDTNYSVNIVAWKCSNCKQQLLSRWSEDTVVFPIPEGNMTSIGNTLSFTSDSGIKHVFISFSTIELNSYDEIRIGRFSCATLGLAWFTQQRNGWKLMSFTPAIGCYGEFRDLPAIKMLRLGKNNYGCYIENNMSGAGGPTVGTLVVFAPMGREFKELLTIDDPYYLNSMFLSYDSKISGATSSNTQQFEDITLKIDGLCNIGNFDTIRDFKTSIPEELLPFTKARDSFSFKISRNYRFKEGVYQLSGSKTDVGDY